MTTKIRKAIKRTGRTLRETRMFVRAMQSASHPILAQVVPIRRCNLDCSYCNEYDKVSDPVPLDIMLRRIDRLADLGTTIITLSGGEPTLHPDLDAIVAQNSTTGCDRHSYYEWLSADTSADQAAQSCGSRLSCKSASTTSQPDETSKKSLKVLDRKLQWLAEFAEFGVTINSVLGAGIRNPEDAVSNRPAGTGTRFHQHRRHSARPHRTVDAAAQPGSRSVYDRFRRLKTSLFSFAHFDEFQQNISRAAPTNWHCRAGGRFLYICEEGLVHYCSQQRGRPGIPA